MKEQDYLLLEEETEGKTAAEPSVDWAIVPMLQSWEEAMADIEASEQEFEKGETVTGEEFDRECKKLISQYSEVYAY